MASLRFQDASDAALCAIDEGIMNFTEASGKSLEELSSICEAHIIDRDAVRSARRRRKGRIRDHAKSRLMKKAWRKNRRRFLVGIKKFNRSMKGKKIRKEVSRMRRQGRYDSIAEAMTLFSSTLTHLAIQAGYNSSCSAEVESELLLDQGRRIFEPIMEALTENPDLENFTLKDIVNEEDAEEAELFLQDVVLGVEPSEEDLEECDEHSQAAIAGTTVTGDYDDDPHTRQEKTVLAKSLVDRLTGENDNKVNGSELNGEGKVDPEDKPDDGKPAEGKVEESNSLEDLTQDMIDINESRDIMELDGEQFEILESAGDPDVDGEHIIAKVRGPAFFPGMVSQNKVEYTLDLWTKALNRPEFKQELAARRIYGTIGHDLEINDKSIRAGLLSHIISDMWIDPKTGQGMAEYLLLNTQPGRMVKTLLGAKSKFRVSTRCKGKFLTKFNHRGNKEPDPNLFFIRGIDFVHDPGFEGTSANLVA